MSCADVHLYRDEGLLSPTFILLAQRFRLGMPKTVTGTGWTMHNSRTVSQGFIDGRYKGRGAF